MTENMKIIRASKKKTHGNNAFHIEILFPGIELGLKDTGFQTIGRIDHASFRPPGFVPMHPHRDDEIFSYMRSGAMFHKDSSGHKERVTATHMMMMNAGSGVSHEEGAEEDVEMLQIFMRPERNSLPPKVQFHEFKELYSENDWRLLAGNAKTAPLELRTSTNIYDVRLPMGDSIDLPVSKTEVINFLYCFDGTVAIGGEMLHKGDSAVLDPENERLAAVTKADLVVFQIAKDATFSDTGMFSGNQFRF